MTMMSSRCRWTLFISVALLLVIACRGQGFEESTMEDQEDQFLEHENATARKSSLPRHLCRNFVGCTCDGKHEIAECSCAISSTTKLHHLQIDTVPIPSTVKEIHISDCPALNISHPGILADCKFKKLYISNVDHLRIDGLILKHVDHLSIQQVDKLELDHDAFQCLEADTVRFQGVTFAPGSTMDINSVQSLLEIDHCNLTDAKILLVNSSQTDRTVSITNSHLDRFSAKIRAADFIMNENTFVRLPSGDRMVSVEYSRSLELKRNKYGIMDSYMPDVQLSNTTRNFHIDSKKGLSSDSLRWLEHLEGIGMTGHSRLGACEKRNPRDTLTHFNVYKSIKDVALVLQSKEKKGVVVGNNTSHLGTGTNTNEEGHAKLRNNVTSTHSFTSTILSFITSALIILILTF